MSMIDSKNNRNVAQLKHYSGPCPYCGYQLKNPDTSRCPECGSHLLFRLVAPFRFTPWHAMLYGLAISIGACLDRVFLSIVGIINSNAWFVIENQMILLLEMFGTSFLGMIIVCVGFYVVWRQKKWFVQIVLWKRMLWYFVAIAIPIVVTVTQYYLLIYFVF